MRILFATVAAACLAMAGASLFAAHDAKAAGKSKTLYPKITCPVGTCGGGGGPKAKDVSYCSAANCRKKSGAK